MLLRPVFIALAAFALSCQADQIQVSVTSYLGDNQTFRQGDPIAFVASLDQDAYLLAVYEDVNGGLTQILPNAQVRTGFFKAGDFVSIPGQESRFEFRVTPPYGKEHLWVFVCNQALPLGSIATVRPMTNGLYAIDTDIRHLKQRLRQYVNDNKLKYGVAHTTIHTQN